LALRRCLLRRIRPGQQILEVGTGPYAILSIFLAKRVRCDIVACDIDDTYVMNARKTIELNEVPVKVVNSNLFEGISDRFDIVFFNSVYIPRSTGTRLGIDRLHDRESDWCGGETGTEVIERFLKDAPSHLKVGGEILLGFNIKYLREDSVVRLCDKYSYYIQAYCTTFLNPSRVIVMRKQE
jgi:release factor glutamine methyltransferase